VKRVIVMLCVTALLVGCATDGKPSGKYHKWFNPHGDAVEDVVPDVCGKTEFPPPADIPPKIPGDVVPAGWSMAVYTLMVDAVKVTKPEGEQLASGFDLEYCVPVSLYVYATAAGQPATLVEMDSEGVGRAKTMPWSALRDTPWRSTIVVAWDPQTRPPVMNFELSAKYEIGEGLARAAAPTDGTVGMMCRIRQENITISMSVSHDIFGPTAVVTDFAPTTQWVTGPFVRCRPPAFTASARV
jgi:hypothetical protein